MTILPMLDYDDIIYRLAGKGDLERLDVLYHSAIRFATNAPLYRIQSLTTLVYLPCKLVIETEFGPF